MTININGKKPIKKNIKETLLETINKDLDAPNLFCKDLRGSKSSMYSITIGAKLNESFVAFACLYKGPSLKGKTLKPDGCFL